VRGFHSDLTYACALLSVVRHLCWLDRFKVFSLPEAACVTTVSLRRTRASEGRRVFDGVKVCDAGRVLRSVRPHVRTHVRAARHD